MAKRLKNSRQTDIPKNYRALDGSDRLPRRGARRSGPADPNETIILSIYLRQRADAPPRPKLQDYAKIPLGQRKLLSRAELAARHGASPKDLKVVTDFANASGLKVMLTDAARRLVQVSGTVAQLSKAFAVKLSLYRSYREAYRGHEGQIYLPSAVADVVEGVFGLDNRRMARRMGAPGTAVPLTPPQVAQAYNFPTPTSAAKGQTIAILEFSGPTTAPLKNSTAGFAQSDINGFINNLNTTTGSTLVAPTVTAVSVDPSTAAPGNVPGGSATNYTLSDPDVEVALDIEVVVSVAQNANVVVYFAPITEQGWVDAISQIVADANNDPSVLSISWGWPELEANAFLSPKDATQSSWPFQWTQQAFTQMTQAFAAAAAIGMTVLASSGDNGSDCQEQDGNAHVLYPASDPGVISCGGTIINTLSPLSEGTWNDNQVTTTAGVSTVTGGATGGGVSYLVDPVSWQTNANVLPVSANTDKHKGRGVPDVAGNASPNSGYNLWLYGKAINSLVLTSGPGAGNTTGVVGGTSAVAPLYAGLIALINASLSTRVGYLNPTLYSLSGTSVFRDINDGISNAIQWKNEDGSVGGPSAGYTSGPGWDACTGLGSIDGTKLLDAIASQIYAQQKYYFQVNKGSYGLDEVAVNTFYTNSLWLVLEGFTPNDIAAAGIVIPTIDVLIPGVTVTAGTAQLELLGQTSTPQRVLFPCTVTFDPNLAKTVTNGGIFPAPNNSATQEQLSSAVTIDQQILTAQTTFYLEAGADPFFSNFTPQGNNAFWLSEDLRVFTVTPGLNKAPIDNIALSASNNTGFDTQAGYGYIQSLLAHLNSTYSDATKTDPFTLFPDQSGALTGDSSVTPTSVNPTNPGGSKFANYNFAVARVRLNGPANASTGPNVRVFFRLFTTETNDTDYQPGLTYPSNNDSAGLPGSPQLGVDNVTLPFFATGNYQANADFTANVDYSGDSINNRALVVGASGNLWAYYGCYLNIYSVNNKINGASVLSLLPSTHNCIVAQIAYDDAPIPTGTGAGPENSDKLAQRNLQITRSDNPGPASAHRIPQTFDLRPSAPLSLSTGTLLDYPDELMIDWGDTPPGSTATIYWPQVAATSVLSLAQRLYYTHQLSSSDPNTIQCTVPRGFTYVPIPPGIGHNFAGLFTVDLLPGVVAGQIFTIIVRRISTRQAEAVYPPPPPIQVRNAAVIQGGAKVMRNWRYVVGTFAVRIPVTTAAVMLPPEEDTLAIMKWRLQQMSPSNRWYPVLLRYIGYIAGRIDGLGGDSSGIEPSPVGVRQPVTIIEKRHEYTGKISGLIFDHFGDFEGFILDTPECEHKFLSREKAIAELAQRSWRERLRISVCADCNSPHRPLSILVREPPTPF